jgi:CheY-like chemotaxis protein
MFLSGVSAAPARVLVVDDEIDLLDAARMLLERCGYRVDTAVDGRLGLAAARAKSYDVVVLDITMPNMDGIALGNALRADRMTCEAMIIVHTALSESWVRSVFADYDLFLSKPGGSGLLAQSIAQLLKDRDQWASDRQPPPRDF